MLIVCCSIESTARNVPSCSGCIKLAIDRRNAAWALNVSRKLAKNSNSLRLLLYVMFYNEPPPTAKEDRASVKFVLQKPNKLYVFYKALTIFLQLSFFLQLL